jgi:hypothetical protein
VREGRRRVKSTHMELKIIIVVQIMINIVKSPLFIPKKKIKVGTMA